MFKKRRNLNIRSRVGDEEEAPENDMSQNDNKPIIPKPKKKSQKKLSVLSFEDELEADDGMVFQEKKSSLSYKLRKEMKKEKKEKEREEKLKLLENSDSSQLKYSELDELGIRIVNGREAEVIATLPGDSDESENENSRREKLPVFRSKNSASLDPLKKIIQSGQIPDANVIHLIRKQRQQARERDFIAIDDTVGFEDEKSRLVRDDDNDHSDDDDEEGRINFTVNQSVREKQQRREAFNAAQENDSNGSDHESEWEKQQLQKAGAASKLVAINDHFPENTVPQPQLDIISESEISSDFWRNNESLIPTSVSLPKPVNYQAEGIIKRLRESRQSLEEVFRRHAKESDQIIDDLVVAKANVARCSTEKEPLTQNFQFFQDMRGYVTDLRDCLNEKSLKVNQLEQQVYLQFRQQAQRLVERRRQDIKDQNDDVTPFSGKGNPVDKFRVRRAAEREGRRTRRRRERERKGESNHKDGMSTDDEAPVLEVQRIKTELEGIIKEGLTIFDDVQDEFSDLKCVVSRLETWKLVDKDSYCDAYVSYNLAKIFAPYIRLEMLSWNPLTKENESPEIERMNWFNLLATYDLNTTGTDPTKLQEDSDRKLMSHLVEKVVLAKLKELISCWWDPLSHAQTVRLVNLIRHYSENFPTISPNSKHLRELIKAIIQKIRDCIDNDIFIPMFPKKQFWIAWKLLSSVLMWHKVVNDSIINDLGIRSILNLYLLPALNLAAEINFRDALDKCRNTINSFPRAWARSSDGTYLFLDRLENFLVTLAVKMDPSNNVMEMREVVELLRLIGAKTQAQVIVNKYL